MAAIGGTMGRRPVKGRVYHRRSFCIRKTTNVSRTANIYRPSTRSPDLSTVPHEQCRYRSRKASFLVLKVNEEGEGDNDGNKDGG
jgi:hypothetical protein